MRIPFLALSVLVLFGVVAGCDSGDPVNPPTPIDVEGTYDFVEFRFIPTASGIQPAVVLDSLVAADTFLELLGSGQMQLRYRFMGDQIDFIPGTFAVSATQVAIQFSTGFEAELARLLLLGRDAGAQIIIDRDGDDLVFGGSRVVNLAAYDPATYGGLTEVPGTLQIRVRLRTT